jgi:hypothetical protein
MAWCGNCGNLGMEDCPHKVKDPPKDRLGIECRSWILGVPKKLSELRFKKDEANKIILIKRR